MNHPIQTASAILLLVSSGWYFSRNYDVHGLQGVRIESRQASSGDTVTGTPWAKPAFPSTETFTSADVYPASETLGTLDTAPTNSFVEPVRIASFNVQAFGRQKADKPLVLDQIARLCRQFDLVALQGIIGPDRDLLPRLVETINRSGGQFEYLELVNYGERSRLGFVFDARRIQTDRRQLYRVQDPNQEIAVDPIVGWFRVRGLPTDKAWTFSLVNVWIDPSQAGREILLLPQLIRAVQADGRHEDDVVVAGSFATETAVLQRLTAGLVMNRLP